MKYPEEVKRRDRKHIGRYQDWVGLGVGIDDCLMGDGFYLVQDGNVLELEVLIAQHCECSKCH